MRMRTRKLVGTVLLVSFVSCYFLIAMVVTALVLDSKPVIVQVLGYAFAGLVWIVPAAWIIWWMSKPDRPA